VERAGRVPALDVPAAEVGAISVEGFALTPEQRLAAFVVLGVFVSVVGIRVATHFSGVDLDEVEQPAEP
jgi:putative membrane protein